jgi:hypothetical protein
MGMEDPPSGFLERLVPDGGRYDKKKSREKKSH